MANEIPYDEKQANGRPVEHESEAVKSLFCGSLRSKKFFMMDGVATEASHYLDGSNYCWCCLTQQVVGPDGSKVNPARCVQGRSCYSSALGGC